MLVLAASITNILTKSFPKTLNLNSAPGSCLLCYVFLFIKLTSMLSVSSSKSPMYMHSEENFPPSFQKLNGDK